jgi:hypothetical protein
MTILTPEQRQAIERAGDEPIRVEDPETKRTYVLISEEAYRRMQQPVDYDDGDWTEEEREAQLREFGRRAGWDDPAMHVYDDPQP